MKTYRSTPLSSLSTAAAIEKTGENFLYSALNFGRVIAFTGSGSTMEYGRPSWADLVGTFIMLAKKNNENIRKKYNADELAGSDLSLESVVNRLRLDTVWSEFEKLFGDQSVTFDEDSEELKKQPTLEYKKIPPALRHNADFTTSFLTLCEQIASWSDTDDDREKRDRRLKFRTQVANEFAKNELGRFYQATLASINHELTPTIEEDRKFNSADIELLNSQFKHHFLRRLNDVSGTTRINSKATIAILCSLLARAVNNTGTTYSFDPEILNKTSEASYQKLISIVMKTQPIDPLTEIYQGLGIKRYLTLNYDIEIERMLATHLANTNDNDHREFCDFLNNPVDIKIPKQERELRNGLQQAIRTSSIGKDNLGDLFTFGAFSSSFESSVFHLHGRVDDPANMVITQLDYERLYLQSSNQRRSFEEARHAVFNGGDILFVGSGMKESDVMAPLRDFTARHRKLDDAPGRVYALILSSIGNAWQAENTGLSLTLFKHYGVYTLFLDGSESNHIHARFRAARQWFTALSTRLGEGTLTLSDLLVFCTGVPKPKNKVLTLSAEAAKLAHEADEVKLIDQAIKEIAATSTKEKIKRSTDIKTSIEVAILERLIIEAEKRLKSNILQHKLIELCRNKTQWWQDWERRPKHRLAVYGLPTQTDDEPLIWVRHRADYHYDKDTLKELVALNTLSNLSAQSQPNHSSSQSANLYQSYFQQLIKEAKKTNKNPSRIVRFTAPKGAGKGGLIRLLSTQFDTTGDRQISYPFELIFPNDNDKGKTNYVGGFFAHLTFTLEFTSTIFALIRFISKATGLEDDEYLNAKAISGFQQDRHTGIWLLKRALREMAREGKRVFICLSGLFRLVDDDGDAFSPVHREFFRVITKTDSLVGENEGEKPKVDLLLIARTLSKPIRYLSNEKPISSEPDTIESGQQYVFRKYIKIEKWPIFTSIDSELVLKAALESARVDFKNLSFHKSLVNNRLAGDESIKPFLTAKHETSEPHINSLGTFINKSVVHLHLVVCLLCWRQIILDKTTNNLDQEDIHLLINRLNIAIGKSGATGLTQQIIQEHRVLDLVALKHEKTSKKVAAVNITDVTLRHLALFNHPIQASVLLECPDLSLRLEQRIIQDKIDDLHKGDEGNSSEEGVSSNKPSQMPTHLEKKLLLEKALDQLVAKRLSIRVQSGSSHKNEHSRYSLHHEIAKVVTLDMNYITQYTLSSAPYQTTLYCAQAQARRGVPSADHFHFVTRLLQHFISILDFSLSNTNINPAKNKTIKNKLKFHECSALLRGGYAILRGSFSIGAISRLEIMHELNDKQPYEAYRLWIQNIIHLSIRLSNYQDDLIDKGVKQKKVDEQIRLANNLPFYRDEVAWLYNEQAVVSFMQGKLYDSTALYQQALSVIKARPEYSENQSVHAPKRRIEVNLAIAEIERGNIHSAIDLLDNTVNNLILKKESTPSMAFLYAQGYRALCDHLTGNFTQAKHGYKKVIKQVQMKRQLRATSIFQRHLADLYRIQGEIEKASKLLLLSEKAASQAQQEDILHYTLISRARLMRDLKSRSDALQILRRTEDYAKTMGLRKMLAEALKVRAEVMLAEGEVTQAGKMSAQAVAIFNRNGLRLRKISAALLQAKVYRKRGQIKFAKKILAEIEREASSLGYTLKASSAQDDRQNIPE